MLTTTSLSKAFLAAKSMSKTKTRVVSQLSQRVTCLTVEFYLSFKFARKR